MDKFDFDQTFLGYSSGLEGNLKVIGIGVSLSNEDEHGKYLLSRDIEFGPGLGGSASIGSVTYGVTLFRFW